MNQIRRYSVGARGEHIYHEEGPHVSYADHVKVVQDLNEKWIKHATENPASTEATVSDFWSKLGGGGKLYE